MRSTASVDVHSLRSASATPEGESEPEDLWLCAAPLSASFWIAVSDYSERERRTRRRGRWGSPLSCRPVAVLCPALLLADPAMELCCGVATACHSPPLPARLQLHHHLNATPLVSCKPLPTLQSDLLVHSHVGFVFSRKNGVNLEFLFSLWSPHFLYWASGKCLISWNFFWGFFWERNKNSSGGLVFLCEMSFW
jgi:hypothetical protein